jgi:hypothetical protein
MAHYGGFAGKVPHRSFDYYYPIPVKKKFKKSKEFSSLFASLTDQNLGFWIKSGKKGLGQPNSCSYSKFQKKSNDVSYSNIR